VGDTVSAGLKLGLGPREQEDELLGVDSVPSSYESGVWV